MVWFCMFSAVAIVGILAWEPTISWETMGIISRVWPKDD